MLLSIVIIISRLDFDISKITNTAIEYNKLRFIDFNLDLSKTTIWVFILYAFGKLNVYLSNQAIIQRFISTNNEKEAGKSMVYNAVLSFPVFFIFLIFGVLIFVYYHHFPFNLNPLLETQDEVVPYFIISELPQGISGIMIASLFAASMSSFDSGINSTTTVITTDFYIRYRLSILGLNSLQFAKILTAILGIFGTIIALYFANNDVSSLYDMFIEIIGIFGGGLAGTFLLGIITIRGNSIGAFWGIIMSLFIVLVVKYFTSIHFFTYAFIGMGSSFLIGYLISLIFVSNPNNLKGLTLYTLKK
ncbi:Sodium:solute symporter family protein [Tangfeifania diversioriginum]|uniref:Sodium:solute symporter family protein n=2 Tax=Tangfeifania diversioriginum TaxID=1168035 RepID=A0A1M6PN19_9BACT|nr:Sodium:solute symporter family protein [Tangfeifania diversioriginum]